MYEERRSFLFGFIKKNKKYSTKLHEFDSFLKKIVNLSMLIVSWCRIEDDIKKGNKISLLLLDVVKDEEERTTYRREKEKKNKNLN
jgi:hypothetical protein